MKWIASKQLSLVQSFLSLERWSGTSPQFASDKCNGRVALVAAVLGTFLGFHIASIFALLIVHQGALISDKWHDVLRMLLQLAAYGAILCTFHLLEFFVTAVYIPKELSADSFMVNHSKVYTAAALISWVEFAIRFIFFRQYYDNRVVAAGLAICVIGQGLRSTAMAQCGESFNHYIQRDKKENHRLITTGVYSILRHPSYVGFYYWAVATQMVLGNPLSGLLYSFAAYRFFARRIGYEEELLVGMFEEYEDYMNRTYIGIPFVSWSINRNKKKRL